MLRMFAALLFGEALLGLGLWLAWAPLAPIVFGLQIIVGVLLHEQDSERGEA